MKLKIKNPTLDPNSVSPISPLAQAHDLMRDMLTLPSSLQDYAFACTASSGAEQNSWCVCGGDFMAVLMAFSELIRVLRNRFKAEENLDELMRFDVRFPSMVRNICELDMSVVEAIANGERAIYFASPEEMQAYRDDKLAQMHDYSRATKRFECVAHEHVYTSNEDGHLYNKNIQKAIPMMEQMADLLMDHPDSAILAAVICTDTSGRDGNTDVETAAIVRGNPVPVTDALLQLFGAWRDQIKAHGDLDMLNSLDRLLPNLVTDLCNNLSLFDILKNIRSASSGMRPVAQESAPLPRNRAERRRAQKQKDKRMKIDNKRKR